jgi:hypothetical protein
MTTATNRLKADRYLTDVCAYMISKGVLAVPRGYKRPADDHESSEIRGLDHWCIRLSRTFKMDLSGSLDDLKQDTEDDGKEFGAVVQYRVGRTVDEQYVVLDLETFSRVVKRLEAVA